MNAEVKSNHLADRFQEASPLKRNIAGFVDAAIAICMLLQISFYLPQSILDIFNNSIWGSVAIILLLAIYRLISLFLFHGTIGMRMSRIRLLNAGLEKPSILQKIFAAFFILVNGVDFYSRCK